jgi:hypothetical protein
MRSKGRSKATEVIENVSIRGDERIVRLIKLLNLYIYRPKGGLRAEQYTQKSRHYIIIASIIRRNKKRGEKREHNAPIVTRQHEILAIYHIDGPHE